jgi:hypothetical protein
LNAGYVSVPRLDYLRWREAATARTADT